MDIGKPHTDKRSRLIETAHEAGVPERFQRDEPGGHRPSRPCSGRERLLLLQDQGRTWRGRCGAALGAISRIPGGYRPVELSEGAAVCFCGNRSWEPGAACAWGMSAGRLLFRTAQGV